MNNIRQNVDKRTERKRGSPINL